MFRKSLLMACAAAAFAAEDAPPEHKQWMKDLGDQNGALRKGVDVEKNAAAMEATLKQVREWWAKRPNSEIALKTTDEGIAGAAKIAKAGGDAAAVGEGMKLVGGSCRGCHMAHREKISETEYKIK